MRIGVRAGKVARERLEDFYENNIFDAMINFLS